MIRDDTLAGVDSRTVNTDRLEIHYLESGGNNRASDEGETVIFLHGNVSSSRFFEDVMAALPARHRAIAPDLRGYGDSETKPINATNGLGDFEGDLRALVGELDLERPFVLVGWSNGGGVAMRYAIDHPQDVADLVLVNPLSPYGFGGTKDTDGTPCFDDYAGSGGGIGNDGFVAGLENRDRSEEGQTSPRKVLRTYYVDPTHEFDDDREESYLTGMLDTATGDENYPGSSKRSDNWPGVAPGETGVNNAISPKYCDLEGITEIDPDEKPPVLWIRGDSDQIVSNASLFDLGTLGRMGELPDWPGEDVFPPQPMVDQTRAVLETYADRGSEFEEVVFGNTGHTPHLEMPGDFQDRLEAVLRG
ncbi:alpha/beta hydrolase [Natrinema sp. SYSU A 869]|uniref:alpha/beta fold hydrolase n=1 Tax=Natrinema sp. SYSU A 869 TaxID=2871694 RepID=UPI001CA45897|nr:alpha/beta hydrolase [Natrinema sp. SYSU A 869]